MKTHDESIAQDRLSAAAQTGAASLAGEPLRNRWTAACVGLTFALLLWTFGYRTIPSHLHPASGSRATFDKLWDKHEDLTRASIPDLVRAASRRLPNASTHMAAPVTAVALPAAAFRPAEERRPVAFSPHIAQIHLRAPPALA
jgi:hypothetical protein